MSTIMCAISNNIVVCNIVLYTAGNRVSDGRGRANLERGRGNK